MSEQKDAMQNLTINIDINLDKKSLRLLKK